MLASHGPLLGVIDSTTGLGLSTSNATEVVPLHWRSLTGHATLTVTPVSHPLDSHERVWQGVSQRSKQQTGNQTEMTLLKFSFDAGLTKRSEDRVAYSKSRSEKTATPVADGATCVGDGFPTRLAVAELTVRLIVVAPATTGKWGGGKEKGLLSY